MKGKTIAEKKKNFFVTTGFKRFRFVVHKDDFWHKSSLILNKYIELSLYVHSIKRGGCCLNQKFDFTFVQISIET